MRPLRAFWCRTPLDIEPANQQTCSVKTTIDLPSALVRDMKLRAVREGRKLKDVAAELLRRGMDAGDSPDRGVRRPRIVSDPVSGLRVVHSDRSTGFVPPTLEESLALVAEANHEEDLRRAGLPD